MVSKVQRRNLRYYIKQHKGLTLGYFISSILAQVFNVTYLFMIAFFLADLTATNYDNAMINLVLAISCYIAYEVSFGVIYKFFYMLVAKVSNEIKVDLAEQVFKISSKTFAEKSSGIFINRINNDPERALWSIESILDNVMALATATFTTGYIFFESWAIGLVYLVALTILFVLEMFRIKVYAKNEKAEKTAADESNGLTTEIIRSEKDIKALNLEKQLKDIIKQNYGNQSKNLQKKHTINMYFWSSRGIAVQITQFVALFLGVFWVKDIRLSIATFLFIFTNRISFENIIWRFGNTATEITNLRVATSRMFELFDNNKFKVEKFGNVDIEVNGEIEFKNVKFSYLEDQIEDDSENDKKETSTQSQMTKKLVFEDLSFVIPANSTVAFVGKSGSGKTTILSLISKLYDVDERGQVLIDNVDIQLLSQNTLRQSISLVNQFPYIFNTTILQNIKMAKEDATFEDVIEAAKKASLHDFVMGLRFGYETKVGESGIKLSGGQRQRLAIARALLKKSKIILFDESTSSLDNATQEEIKQSLQDLSGQHTVIIVAHRLSTIKNADKIFFLHNGEIVAQGTFEQLISSSPDFEDLFKAEII
ncbi:MAG: ABC transporter ATP-binding protein/permease [Firmicutes bacterium]|nr:ABC transporter ATP-binding protein/permease [Bacillota bacterium]MCL1954156.1 ABC transporter ATP-binding protein/permease [Bacillota bacterium]